MDLQEELQQAYAKFEAADRAGDAETARAIKAYAESLESQLNPEPPRNPMYGNPSYDPLGYLADKAEGAMPDLLTGLLRAGSAEGQQQFMQGLTLGTSDEIMSGIGSLMGMDYDELQQQQQQDLQRFKTEHPGPALTAEVAGGISGPGKLLSFAKTPRAMMGTGLGEGMVALAGYGDDSDTMSDMAVPAALTLTAATLAPPLVSFGGGALVNAAGEVGDMVKRRIYSDTGESAHLLDRAIRGDIGSDPALLQRQLDALGPEGVLADVGPNTRGLAALAAREPGRGRQAALDAVQNRQVGSQARVTEAAREAIGPEYTDYYGYQRSIAARRRADAGPDYEAAYSSDYTPSDRVLRDVFETDLGRQAQRRAGTLMEADGYSSAAPDADGLPGSSALHRNTRYGDYLGRALRDMEGEAFRSGNGSLGNAVRGIRRRLNDDIYEQVPALREARNRYAGSKRLEEAAEEGRGIFKGDKFIDDVDEITRDYTEGELEAFRVGAFDAVTREVRRTASYSGDSARRLIGTPKVREILTSLVPDDNARVDLIRKLIAESEFNRTMGMVDPTQQSITSSIQQEAGALGGTDVFSWIRRLFSPGMDEKTAGELTDVLFGTLSREHVEELARRAMGARGGSGALVDPRGQAVARLLTPSAFPLGLKPVLENGE